jgi:hypothetical protein
MTSRAPFASYPCKISVRCCQHRRVRATCVEADLTHVCKHKNSNPTPEPRADPGNRCSRQSIWRYAPKKTHDYCPRASIRPEAQIEGWQKQGPDPHAVEILVTSPCRPSPPSSSIAQTVPIDRTLFTFDSLAYTRATRQYTIVPQQAIKIIRCDSRPHSRPHPRALSAIQ